jgi:hypothetical protein
MCNLALCTLAIPNAKRMARPCLSASDPISYETICGLTSIYLDLHTKYSWGTMLEFLAMSAVVFIVIAGILYSAKLEKGNA